MRNLSIILLIFITINSMAQQTHYLNPVLSGFHPDPSICRVGNDYYIVNSTFAYFPGIPIYHSRDLANWKLIGHAITREEQMDFSGLGVSRGIFAPAIRYHKGLFYITCTLVDGKGNFVVTAKDPAGPWSNPVWLPFDGIDPSLFWDDDEKCYITYNSIPPDNISLYDGHRTIRLQQLDLKNLKLIGENKILVNGGTDLSQKPSWIEGPHLLKKDGYYYLIAAEGGTGADHSVVVFRSKNVDGPFVPYENNPVLTQRHLRDSRSFPITSTGHADLVELPDGRWYAVFLGTRPYEADYFNTGRETFLTPVVWQNGWPLLNPGYETVQYSYPIHLPVEGQPKTQRYSGNFSFTDNFDKSKLDKDWIFLRTVKEPWYHLNSKTKSIELSLRPETVAGKMNPSYLARRQHHARFMASTSLSFNASASNEKAGLLCFINEDHFYFLCQSIDNGIPVVQLYRSPAAEADSNSMVLIAKAPLQKRKAVQLNVSANKDQYIFSFSTDGKKWQPLGGALDGKFLTTKMAGGFGSNFVGCTVGLYATSLGMNSSNKASYRWFRYSGDDEVYKNQLQ